MKCLLCNPSNEYEGLHIKSYKYWHIELRSNQNYLGWCLIVLNRHIEDLMDITISERQELFKITKRLRDGIKDIFHPDSFNYASLGNVTNHVHLQFIPRYAKTITFQGNEFSDKNFGSNYSPYDNTFDITDDVKKSIVKTIQSAL